MKPTWLWRWGWAPKDSLLCDVSLGVPEQLGPRVDSAAECLRVVLECTGRANGSENWDIPLQVGGLVLGEWECMAENKPFICTCVSCLFPVTIWAASEFPLVDKVWEKTVASSVGSEGSGHCWLSSSRASQQDEESEIHSRCGKDVSLYSASEEFLPRNELFSKVVLLLLSGVEVLVFLLELLMVAINAILQIAFDPSSDVRCVFLKTKEWDVEGTTCSVPGNSICSDKLFGGVS